MCHSFKGINQSPAVIAGLGLPPSALLSAFHSFRHLRAEAHPSCSEIPLSRTSSTEDRPLFFFFTFFYNIVPTACLFFCCMCVPSEVKRAEKGFPQSAIRNGGTQACTDKKYAEQLCWIKCFLKGGQHATRFTRSLAHKVIWLSRLPVSTSCFPSMAE